MATAVAASDASNIRILRASDASAMTSLIQGPGIGWQQTTSDVEHVLEQGTVLGIHDSSQLASTAAWIPTGNDFGWLAYVATAPASRRRGHARELVSRLLATTAAQGGCLNCGLFGSELGAPLYASLGFSTRGDAQFVEAQLPLSVDQRGCAQRPDRLVPAAEALPQLLALDAVIYGVDRSALLTRWSQRMPEAGWVLLSADGHTADGYVLGRAIHPAGGAWIGPLVARDVREAESLLRAALEGAAASGCDKVQALLPALLAFEERTQTWQPRRAADGSVGAGEGGEGGEDAARALAARYGFRAVGTPSLLMVRSDDPRALPPWAQRLLPEALQQGSARPFAATGFEFG